ncbi:DUF1837 domain-containing protein [Nitratidesulfovibrio sp. SRB-5]|uniref:HamA C-terminal domain-containing protein n=1 Tax=Nitratidesulfovibrio sp. SRB-5 TaxID=2872636 RepID=UPI0010268D02|nr:DUF1837 domain-containing protein [Nitratidesulfovibrio sp. SRB-5]MBZ2171962.1 DUF1837 domain-containing protein [Nitratidesulfovibrio sp. SRB-5]RXF78557.1 DUF1837 domain-containing protein [Desulfovibrio sp. DS-1]
MRTMVRKATSLIIKHEISFSQNGPHAKDGFTLSYNEKGYRDVDLVRLIAHSLPLFALTEREIQECVENGELSAIQEMALSRISQAKRDKKGDYGEALLFILLAAFYGNERIVTKLKLRSSSTEQIKGFDCANFTYENGELTVWLGEVKFYQDFSSAVDDVIEELVKHTTAEYIKGEFRVLLPNCEINRNSPLRDRILSVLDGSTSLDKVKIKIPVLLTCNSTQLSRFNDASSENFLNFVDRYFSKKFEIIERKMPKSLERFDVVFIVLPLHDVKLVKKKLDDYEKVLEL